MKSPIELQSRGLNCALQITSERQRQLCMAGPYLGEELSFEYLAGCSSVSKGYRVSGCAWLLCLSLVSCRELCGQWEQTWVRAGCSPGLSPAYTAWRTAASGSWEASDVGWASHGFPVLSPCLDVTSSPWQNKRSHVPQRLWDLRVTSRSQHPRDRGVSYGAGTAGKGIQPVVTTCRRPRNTASRALACPLCLEQVLNRWRFLIGSVCRSWMRGAWDFYKSKLLSTAW